MKYRIAIIIAVLALSACKDKPAPAAPAPKLPAVITNCKEDYKRWYNLTIDTPLMFQYCNCLVSLYSTDTNRGRTEQSPTLYGQMTETCRDITSIKPFKGN